MNPEYAKYGTPLIKLIEECKEQKTMPLNKAKGNMYGFITDTFNIVKGACSHDCP
jgi:hypothetical protein